MAAQRKGFEKFDRDHSGTISVREFSNLCREMGYILTDRELEMDLKLLDSNGDGVIGPKNILTHSQVFKWWQTDNRFESLQLGEENLQLLTEISAHFRKFDRDGSGRVDVTEFKHMYADLVKMKLTNKSMLTTLQELDTDRDGKVNFNEYVVWLLKQNNTGGK
ncbi:hypothetical protein HK105_205614 [Polyrhizophydium stewartii]|uniref:EF-hand domain-containing protein n=1 Tax=Polyrhizophydium stewartii TaxID=2732419 RepID=A0ABR4N5P7_9FUNG